MSNEQPEQTAEGLIGWLRDDADFQDHQRENGITMLPAAEDAPHLRAAADMLERLESKLDTARQLLEKIAAAVNDPLLSQRVRISIASDIAAYLEPKP